MGNPPSVPSPPAPNSTPSPTCETYATDGVPQLMVTVADVDDAGTGNEVFARILTASASSGPSGKGSKGTTSNTQSTEWSEWQLLGHTNCADLSVAKTEYFDEFSDITSPWLAVAVYNCGDDDVVIDTIGVWTGATSEPVNIDYFCPNIAGPSNTCAEEETSGAIGTCYQFSDMEPTDYFRLDQDTCGAFSFETGSLSTDGCPDDEGNVAGCPIATAYVTDDPGVPDCTVSSMMHRRSEQRLMAQSGLGTESSINMSMFDVDNVALVAIPAAAVLTGALAYVMCLKKTNQKDTEYASLKNYGTN